MNKQEIEKAISWHKELLSLYEFERATYEDICGTGELTDEERKEVYEDLNSRITMMKVSINALSQQLTNGWIPVSERLPEEHIDGITDDFIAYNVSLKFEYAECTRTYKFGRGRGWNDGMDMSEYVIAWQPLPEPYKEVSDAERN